MLAASAVALAQQASNIPAAVFAEGQAALARGNLVAAETDFRKVLQADPHSVPARANLGVVFMRRKNWPQALDEFREAERLAPNNPGIEMNIGLAYFRQENFAAAVKPLESVVQRDPSSLQARYLIGLCYFATEKYSEAAAALKPLWSSQNDKMPYLYVLALSANKANEPKLERQALERMYQVGSGSAEYHLFLGRAWLMRQRDNEALKELGEAARLDPKLPFVHYSMGTIYSGAGDYIRARTEFLEDAAVEPDLALNYEQLGAICLKLERPAEAEQYFHRAVELNPRSASSYLALAKIHKTDHEYEKALMNLDAASKIDGNSANLHYLRAQTLLQLHRPTEAKAEFAISARLRKSTRDRLEEQVSGRPGLDAEIGLAQP